MVLGAVGNMIERGQMICISGLWVCVCVCERAQGDDLLHECVASRNNDRLKERAHRY